MPSNTNNNQGSGGGRPPAPLEGRKRGRDETAQELAPQISVADHNRMEALRFSAMLRAAQQNTRPPTEISIRTHRDRVQGHPQVQQATQLSADTNATTQQGSRPAAPEAARLQQPPQESTQQHIAQLQPILPQAALIAVPIPLPTSGQADGPGLALLYYNFIHAMMNSSVGAQQQQTINNGTHIPPVNNGAVDGHGNVLQMSQTAANSTGFAPFLVGQAPQMASSSAGAAGVYPSPVPHPQQIPGSTVIQPQQNVLPQPTAVPQLTIMLPTGNIQAASPMAAAATALSNSMTQQFQANIQSSQTSNAPNASGATILRPQLSILQNNAPGTMQTQPPIMDVLRTNNRLLYIPTDDDLLTENQVLLRQQMEFFEATQEDVDTQTSGRRRPIQLHQVGIRCRHCKCIPLRQRQKASVYYPSKLRSIYQAGQNMNINHLCGLCKHIPAPLKTRLIELQMAKPTTGHGGLVYWATTAQARDVIELEEGGLRFKSRLEEGCVSSPSTTAARTASEHPSNNSTTTQSTKHSPGTG